MFIEAKNAYEIKLKNSLMIGDSHTDIEPGRVAWYGKYVSIVWNW